MAQSYGGRLDSLDFIVLVISLSVLACGDAIKERLLLVEESIAQHKAKHVFDFFFFHIYNPRRSWFDHVRSLYDRIE